MVVFIDDSLVYLKSDKEHIKHLRFVFQTLQEKKLYAKFSKYELWLHEVSFLGHMISWWGIVVYPTKVDTMLQWETHKSVTEIRSFLGLDGYYKMFIEGFSRLDFPQTLLTRKGEAYAWDAQCKEIFQELKKRLMKGTILVLSDASESFVIYCDASMLGLGGVLMHKSNTVAYSSRQIKVHERNYPTHDLELAVVVFGIKVWRNYLYGSRFIFFGDHKSLKYLFDKKELNMRQRKWLEFLKYYHFELSYHLSKTNVMVYALSRKSLHMSMLMAW